MIKNKKILIIGGTGALGKTLVKRYYDSNEIIVLSRDEHKHYYLQKEYPHVLHMHHEHFLPAQKLSQLCRP